MKAKAKKKTTKKVAKKAVANKGLKSYPAKNVTKKMADARGHITKAIEETGAKQYIVTALVDGKLYFNVQCSWEYMNDVVKELTKSLAEGEASCLQ